MVHRSCVDVAVVWRGVGWGGGDAGVVLNSDWGGV